MEGDVKKIQGTNIFATEVSKKVIATETNHTSVLKYGAILGYLANAGADVFDKSMQDAIQGKLGDNGVELSKMIGNGKNYPIARGKIFASIGKLDKNGNIPLRTIEGQKVTNLFGGFDTLLNSEGKVIYSTNGTGIILPCKDGQYDIMEFTISRGKNNKYVVTKNTANILDKNGNKMLDKNREFTTKELLRNLKAGKKTSSSSLGM